MGYVRYQNQRLPNFDELVEKQEVETGQSIYTVQLKWYKNRMTAME